MMTSAPRWLNFLEKRMSWLAVPHIAVLLITCQVAGFLLVASDPVWMMRLALIPEAALRNREWYRVVTFLALPLATGPLWVVFALLFLYFLLNSIETVWGAFRTTLYVLVSLGLTVAFSFAFNYPVTSVGYFESTLFLAAAALFPEMEIRLFMIFPVKMKWMAWVTAAFLVLEAFHGTWTDRLYLVVVYSNFLLFFGPALLGWSKTFLRRRKFQKLMRAK